MSTETKGPREFVIKANIDGEGDWTYWVEGDTDLEVPTGEMSIPVIERSAYDARLAELKEQKILTESWQIDAKRAEAERDCLNAKLSSIQVFHDEFEQQLAAMRIERDKLAAEKKYLPSCMTGPSDPCDAFEKNTELQAQNAALVARLREVLAWEVLWYKPSGTTQEEINVYVAAELKKIGVE